MASLVKSPDLTPKKIAANRANGLRSCGPSTPRGRERARLSNLRHGLYVLSPRDAMVALGEDPQEFDLYEQNLLADWLPRDTFQEALVRRIAHNSWRLDRVRRIQESTSVREVEKLELGREVKAENHTRQIQGVLAALKELLEMARQGNFSDGAAALSAFNRAFGPKPNARGMDIFHLLCTLSPTLQMSRGGVEAQEAVVRLQIRGNVDPNRNPTQAEEEPRPINLRLAELLETEMESVRRYDEGYRLLHIEITAAKRGSTMGPVQAHAATLIQQEASLARQVERDVRLLRWLQDKPRAAR
jgi:hypothetical protein